MLVSNFEEKKIISMSLAFLEMAVAKGHYSLLRFFSSFIL